MKNSTGRGGISGCIWAEDEARTRDLNLGKVALYQLSYFRMLTNYLKKRAVCGDLFLITSPDFTHHCVYFRGCKNRKRRHRHKIFFELFVLGCIQGVPRHIDVRFTGVPVLVHTDRPAERQCDDAQDRQVKNERWRVDPTIGDVL